MIAKKPESPAIGAPGAKPADPRTARPYAARGFALIIVISLTVLLTLLGVGLLSLSTISLRNSSANGDLAEARSNARMALMMAIGQLQKHVGPDRRITVSSDQRSDSADGDSPSAVEGRRHWTGVYDSWGDEFAQRPDPDFRSWLVSGETLAVEDEESPDGAAEEGIELVGEGTIGDRREARVEVPTVRLDGAEGPRIAWWVGDQGLKASVTAPETERPEVKSLARNQLQGTPRDAVELAEAIGEQPFSDLAPYDPRLAKVTGWKQAGLLASSPAEAGPLFHDLAGHSTGLLVDVRRGGFRKDLSMELERSVGASSKEALYEVNREDGVNFEELTAFYQLHSDLSEGPGPQYTTGGRIGADTPYLQLPVNAAQAQRDDFYYFKQPVVLSYQLILSFEARRVTASNGQTVNRLHLVGDPVITLWNPLDVPVVLPRNNIFSVKYWQVPYDLYLEVGAGAPRRCPLISTLSGGKITANSDNNYLSLVIGRSEQLVMKPGEVVRFSQNRPTIVNANNQTNHNLLAGAGFHYEGGVSLPLRDLNGNPIDLAGNSVVRYTARANDLTAGATSRSGRSLAGGPAHTRHFSMTHHEFYMGEDRGANSLGVGGIYIDYDFGNKRAARRQTRGEGTPGTKNPRERLYANRLPDVFPPLTAGQARPLSLSQLLSDKAPFMVFSFEAKTEVDAQMGTRILSRFNPKAHHVDFYDMSEQERAILPYEYRVQPIISWKEGKIEVDEQGRSYYGGGLTAETGTNTIITHSVPREPIVSLGALQHSFANGFITQRPPYGYAALSAREPLLPQIAHAIGNSMAPPMMDSSETEGSLPGGRPMADHSYLANLALWDEWFFSGIAPQTGPGFAGSRSQREVAEEFFSGDANLPVVRYRPNLGNEDATSVVGDLISGTQPNDDATFLVASLLKVDGMFNVNSTSVEAWKSLLGGLREQPVVVQDMDGKERVTAGEEVPVSGLLTPQDELCDGSNNLDLTEPSQWVGRRELSEDEIESLAYAIVREVRKRGPFLSLADFVNRRPGSDEDFARCGAIQSALDSDEVGINSGFNRGSRSVDRSAASVFAFSEAEEGPKAFGAPGLVKQADILTPIAPLLSVRSDTFVIRAYGESLAKNGKVVARAWCEATVERQKDYLDPTDEPETELDDLRGEASKDFGRRFTMTSFRWLHPDEV